MGRKIIAVMTLLLITGCADFDLHVRRDATPVKAAVILIGSFESRNMNYDPYVAAEYREVLRFEFFKKGINALLLSEADNPAQADAEKISALSSKYSGDIFIRGVISQRESGFLTDREVNSTVSFFLYAGDGKQVGEAYYYTDDSAALESVKRSAVERFVNEFLKHAKSR